MEYSIGTGYEVIQVSFPTTNGQPPTRYEWETRSGLTGSAIGGQIFKTFANGSKQGYGISISSLGLSTGEYFKYAKAYLGDIKASILQNDNDNRLSSAVNHLIGRLGS
jgi:hypothetical protein